MSDHENDHQDLRPLAHLAELRAAAEEGRPVWAEPLDAEGNVCGPPFDLFGPLPAARHRTRRDGSVRSSRHDAGGPEDEAPGRGGTRFPAGQLPTDGTARGKHATTGGLAPVGLPAVGVLEP